MRVRRLGAAIALTVLLSAGAARAGVSFEVSVTPAAIRPIPANFLGLALEYRSIPMLVGRPHAVNPALLRLIANLDPGGRPQLRIGGQSTDRTWWPIRGYAKPLGITYDLSRRWIADARALATALDARMSLGIELEANRPRIEAVEATHLVNGIGQHYIDSLAIGNEPELYTSTPWYRDLDGHPIPWYSHDGTPVFARAPGYGSTEYAADVARALAVVPTEPIAGPETGSPTFLSAFAPDARVRTITWHAYGLVNCETDPSSPRFPSVPNLLTTAASRTAIVGGIAPDVARAHADGARFLIDEMGSVTCNGQFGVSNTFASALWAADALFAAAAADVDGVDLHTYPGSANGLFDFARFRGRLRASVHPIYYGALMFAEAAPAGSRLLTVSSPDPGSVRTWATRGLDRRTRVLVINDSLTDAAATEIAVPGVRGAGTLERLTAASAYATGGVSLGGRSFGARTATGTLRALKLTPVTPENGGYTVTLPAASAALLTLPAG